jgi:Amino acid permease
LDVIDTEHKREPPKALTTFPHPRPAAGSAYAGPNPQRLFGYRIAFVCRVISPRIIHIPLSGGDRKAAALKISFFPAMTRAKELGWGSWQATLATIEGNVSMTDRDLMTRKSVAAIIKEAGEHTLGKTLGPLSITALGIGCIIGAGIFVLTGTAAAHYAGPGIMLSFVVGGIACTFVGLCYAELATLLPVSGSTYTYTYATLGEIFAWIIGWDLILEYAMGASTVAVGWSGYIVSLLHNFGINIPPQYAAAPS